MHKKILIILAFMLTSAFNLSTYATDALSRKCLETWAQSSAYFTGCNLTLADIKGFLAADGQEACYITAQCFWKEKYYTTSAQSYLKDVKRLVNCKGSLEYDRC